MSLFDTQDIDRPYTVNVDRPAVEYDGDGNYTGDWDRVATGLACDIQYSLRIRTGVSESGTGTSDKGAWVLYCDADAGILPGDRVSDGERTFTVDAAGDWRTHLECVMRLL